MEGAYKCKLTLPPNAAFQTVVGPSGKDVRLARHLVCLEACKKLHQMGALNDHLVPFIEEAPEAEHSMKNKESSSGAGINVLLINLLSLVINSVEVFLSISSCNYIWHINFEMMYYIA